MARRDPDQRMALEREHARKIAEKVALRRRLERELEDAMQDLASTIKDAQDAGIETTRIATWLPNPLNGWRLGVSRDAVYKLLGRHLPAGRR